jgi:Fur family transcriptional regulator, ferric uptake regulator
MAVHAHRQGAPPDWSEHALEGLRQAGLRRGGAREAVVEWLGRQDCCASAQEIHEGVRAEGRAVGVASVYRTLDTLVDLRLVQRVEIGDGVARFEPAYPHGAHHHHHLVCAACGTVEPFEDAGLERALERVAGDHRYAMAAHDVVVHGTCERCRPAG